MTKQALWYLLLAIVLLGIIGVLHYYAERRAERATRETSERLNVALGKTSIVKTLEHVESDLIYLAKHHESRGLFRSGIGDDETVALAEDFLTFAEQKGIYDQVRFLDRTGMEVVRVNNNDGKPAPVPGIELQNKADRYYFERTWNLEQGQIYISPFDLNVERGQLERPIKPVIRFGTPVFDSADRKTGILLLNYLGDKLLSDFRTATANVADHVSLINADGFWLSSPQREEEWGFMRGLEQTFSARHAAAWDRILVDETGQFETDEGVFTFATVYPIEAPAGAAGSTSSPEPAGGFRPGPWKVVARLAAASLDTTPSNFAHRHWPLYLVMLALLATGAALLARATVRHRLAEGQVAFEQRFRETLENISLKVVGVDRQGHVTFCNDALVELVGWPREDLLGRLWVESLVAPDCRQECERMFARIIAREETPSRHESQVLTRNGERRLLAWSDAPVLGPDRDLVGFTFLGEDITEARHAEEQLLKLSSAVEQSPSTVMITDVDGRIEYVNPKFTDLTGYTLDEVRGMNPRILKSGHTSPEEYNELWNTISSGGEWRGVVQNRKKNGELYWEAATISAVRNLDGEIAHYLAVKEDITERRRLEERFRHCVESAPSAMVLVDAEGNMALVNREAERLFGYAREELVGRSIELLVPESARNAHARYRKAYQAAPENRSMGVGRDLAGQRKDGSLFPVEIGLHPVETEEGTMVLSAVVDITERRRLEDELRKRNGEIAKTQALAVVGRMANMVAHDLRNPLSSIKMGLQIIGKHRAGQLSEQEIELKDIALQQVHYMEDTLDDLLSYSREGSLALEWLDMNKLLDAAVLLAQRHIDDHKVNVTTRYQSRLPTLHGDTNKLRRAFCNLIQNAIQATEGIQGRRPELTISTHLELAPDRPKIRVSICDNGRGLEPNQQTKVFEPFFTTRVTGTGLGLAIVKRIIEQHRGSVDLRPTDICGTCASVILPTGPVEAGPRPEFDEAQASIADNALQSTES